jgi:choline kinase
LQEDCGDLLKPLTPLLGVTLLERAVLSCREAGVTECYVVVGYGRERIVSHITELACRHSLRLHAVDNPHWPEGNGTSALAVGPYLDGAFLLIMCDHVFEPAILRSLVEAGSRAPGCLLAVDRRIDQIFDLEDATKVRLRGQAITAIGKDLATFDAVDMGLFLCRPMVFKALLQARANGDGSLTGGMRWLTTREKLHAVDVGDRFWCDIDTPQSLQWAERALLSRLHNPKTESY